MARSKKPATRAQKITQSVKKTAARVGAGVAAGATAAKEKAQAAYGAVKNRWEHRRDEEE